MTITPATEEAALLVRIAQQDQNALSALYDRYARVLYSVAYKILGSVEEAEEVVLDVFSQVWKKAEHYDPQRGRVDAWLFLLTRSRSLDRLRAVQRAGKAIASSTAEAKTVDKVQTPGPEDTVIISERRDRILTALKQLPHEQRQVLEMAYYRGLTHVEIAAQTGISLGTIKTRIRLGLNKLRQLPELSDL